MWYHGLQMAETAAEIVARWIERRPPEVPLQEVLIVVEAYFPGEYTYRGDVRHKSGTSHSLVLTPQVLRVAQKLGWGQFPGGTLCVPSVNGKRVKSVYVQKLLALIEMKATCGEAAANIEAKGLPHKAGRRGEK
jgi:hypothetical protein